MPGRLLVLPLSSTPRCESCVPSAPGDHSKLHAAVPEARATWRRIDRHFDARNDARPVVVVVPVIVDAIAALALCSATGEQ